MLMIFHITKQLLTTAAIFDVILCRQMRTIIEY